jgi:probable addiction module antidote protein
MPRDAETKSRPYDIAELVADPEVAQHFLSEVMESGDASEIAEAIGVVARGIGMASVAQRTGLSRETLYRTLSQQGNPTLSTLLVVLDALGFKLRGVERLAATAAE